MEKTINFGKVDFNGTGRKINKVDVTIELRDTDEGPEFSVCGNIWNGRHTDVVCGGQCLDEINRFYSDNPKFKQIYRLWKRWHCNSLRAGGPKQEQAIRLWLADGNNYDYEAACVYLDSLNLLTENGIKYGAAWHYEQIDPQDLLVIKALLK